MENFVGELSIGGIFAILVIKVVLGFIKWWSERGKVGKAHVACTSCMWTAADERDTPRAHTELLRQILTETKGLRSDVRQLSKHRSDT